MVLPALSKPRTSPRIAAIAISAPDNVLDQKTFFDRVFRASFGSTQRVENLFCNVGVKTRHVFYDPSTAEDGARISTTKRLALWKEGAMELGRKAVGAVLDEVDPATIGSFVVVSSTGFEAPSLDLSLAKEFNLSPSLRRTFIGHMGCQAAFNGLKVALDALAARPNETVLVHCTEISSAHLRTAENSVEQIICQGLFGDASAAIVLSNEESCTGPEIIHTHTEALYEHSEKITLSMRDDGFRLSLSPQVPALIASAIKGFVERMLAPLGMTRGDIRHWGIHPGGPKIIDLVAQEMSLSEAQTRTSRSVLADYGNCASPTVLLILERMLKIDRPEPGSFCVLLAFGPGLTIEGAVLRF